MSRVWSTLRARGCLWRDSLGRSKIKDAIKAHLKGKLRGFVQGDLHKLRLRLQACVLLWSIALASAACGVQEYLHDSEPDDASDDLAPANEREPDAGTRKPYAGDAGMASALDGDDAGVATPGPTTITLGGTPLQKSDVIAFLHFGHSNMAGRATGPTDERPYFFTDTNPQAWMYHVGKMPELATEPDTAGDMKSFDGMLAGPGTALLKEALARMPHRYFMSLGFGKSGATCMQYLPGGLYHESATRAAIAIKDRVTIVAIILMLGISESNAPAATHTQLANCVSQLIDALRKELGQPDLPVLLSDYERGATGAYGPDLEFGRTIIEQLAMVPELVSSTAIIPTDGIKMQDDHHFNLTGYREWSRRALDLLQTRGWFPQANRN